MRFLFAVGSNNLVVNLLRSLFTHWIWFGLVFRCYVGQEFGSSSTLLRIVSPLYVTLPVLCYFCCLIKHPRLYFCCDIPVVSWANDTSQERPLETHSGQ